MTKELALVFGAFFVILLALIFWYLAPGIRANLASCTRETMQCADGSYVTRTGPNCEFSACPGDGPLPPPGRGTSTPTGTPPSVIIPIPGEGGSTSTPSGGGVFCAQDAMRCPDGSYVGRVPPTCQFAACPAR